MADRPAHHRKRLRGLAAAMLCLLATQAIADEPVTLGPLPLEGSSAAYPNGTFGEQLASASQGGGGPVGGPGYRPGPGRRDDWRVGPHWRVTVDGVLLFRDSADLDAVLAEVEPIAPSSTMPPLQFQDNFDHAAGVRLLLTSEFPQCAGYELQVGYLGVDKWLANANWEQETLAAATLPLSDIDVEQQRVLGYESSLHSVEINFQRATRGYLKPFAGLRYIALDEQILDENRQFTTGVLPDPPGGVAGTLASAVTQTRNGVEIENNLIGFQGGVRLDMWRPTRRFHLAGFLSAGVYCNIVDRDRIFQETNTVTTNERTIDATTSAETVTTTIDSTTSTSKVSADGTRIAFTTEAALAGVWRLSNSTALRGGYQIQFLDGVELAEDLWTSPPPITAVDNDLFLHGWFAGIEYRR
ncbi:MAG: hypothetical protein AAF266_03810 [Planctomycetota bacterium]